MSETTTLPRDIRLEVRVRNNLILTRMEALGISTVIELARRASVSVMGLYNLINMRRLPVCKNGTWRPSVLKMAMALKCAPEELFSAEQMEHVLDAQRSFAEMNFGQLRALITDETAPALEPDRIAERVETRALIAQAMSTLSPREQIVLQRRFGLEGADYTLEEIGDVFSITRTRIMYIETRALRKMRCDGRRRMLLQAAHED